jgi:predicted exporter
VNSLADAIAARDIPGVRLVDLAAPIVAGMMQLRRHVLMWLGIGSFAAFGVLLVGQADWRRTVSIARTTGAAVVLTAVLMTLITGSLGIFQIVALTLVFGIGIDYGLFLGRTGSTDTRIASFRSVGLCAVSTLLAFSIMAVSPVKLLHEIGLTVFLGVLITLLLHSGRALRSSVLEK